MSSLTLVPVPRGIVPTLGGAALTGGLFGGAALTGGFEGLTPPVRFTGAFFVGAFLVGAFEGLTPPVRLTGAFLVGAFFLGAGAFLASALLALASLAFLRFASAALLIPVWRRLRGNLRLAI